MLHFGLKSISPSRLEIDRVGHGPQAVDLHRDFAGWNRADPIPGYPLVIAPGPHIADLINTYGIPAKAYKGYTLEQTKAQIAADKPVIAWMIGNMVGRVPYEYTDKHGSKTIVAAYEHVVTCPFKPS
jgi:hypothetical protein